MHHPIPNTPQWFLDLAQEADPVEDTRPVRAVELAGAVHPGQAVDSAEAALWAAHTREDEAAATGVTANFHVLSGFPVVFSI